LTTFNLSVLPKLEYLSCKNCKLTGVNISNIPDLLYAGLMFNNLTTLDFSTAPKLNDVRVNNNDLVSIFLKNGKSEGNIMLGNNPTLEYICADDAQLTQLQTILNAAGNTSCALNSYCSFTPGGAFSILTLTQKFDAAGNGCDVADLGISRFKYTLTNGSVTSQFVSNPDAPFSIPLQAGSYAVSASVEIPAYFNISPNSSNVSMNGSSPASRSFCVSPNGNHQDVEVVLVPLDDPRPGFDNSYNVIYRNKGNTSVSGSLTIDFEGDKTDLVSALPVPDAALENQLVWNFTNLMPFEMREIEYTINVNSPIEVPAVNGGDILFTTASICALSGADEMPLDNVFELDQTVVNSFDPNDKTCLEGNVVGPEVVGQFVHYVIRFENTGTFAAENIVVKDVIDTAKFDIASLVSLSGSHPFTTRITQTNKVEFIFQNLNLPFDDANNDGYVAFKIKTKPTLAVGDTFSNTASIYFDYNFPIVTNTETTTIQLLGNPDFEFSDAFTLYPNPVRNVLNIQSKNGAEVKSVGIYNMLGQILQTQTGNANTIDVSALPSAQYFLKVHTANGSAVTGFIRQ
jgi:hypothetical protein